MSIVNLQLNSMSVEEKALNLESGLSLIRDDY